MNKKILGLLLAFIFLAALATPIVAAKFWEPKNNDKFQTFSTALVPNIDNILASIANPEYVPSEADPNKIIYTWVEEPMAYYEMHVGSNTYYLGTDFEYTGIAVVTQIGAPFTPNPDLFGMLAGSKETKFRVDYMYDFSAVEGGIEGTLEMLAITANPGGMHIRSVGGTGDLQNVEIQATGAGMGHIGTVIGWPE